jgi:hypothetical protein
MEYESLTLRIPTDLKHEIEQVAEREHRTLSGQVRFFLESAVRRIDTDHEHQSIAETERESVAGSVEV